MPEEHEYSLSPKSGRLRKKVRVKYKKKKPFFSKKRMMDILKHPLLVLFIIAIIAWVVYISLPSVDKKAPKWKVRTDEKTKTLNKTINETDAY
jgi:hypothetical protein